jgi:hypothetical protein
VTGSDLTRHAAALTGPRGPSSPADVYAAALAILDLQDHGADVSSSFPVVRTCIGEWGAHASGPGMWSDTHSEDEQDRDNHGPAILTTLLGVLVRHALAHADAPFMAGVIAGGEHLSFLYDIVGELMDRDEDLLPLVGPLVDYAIEQMASSWSDSGAYDLLCGIQNFRSTIGRAPRARQQTYVRHIRRQLERVQPRADWRPFVHDALASVRQTYSQG